MWLSTVALLGCPKRLLQTEHLIAYVIANLDRNSILEFELLATTVFQNRLALFVRALVFATPLLVLINQGKQYELSTGLARHFEDVNKLLQNMRARPHSQNTRTLERTIFLPSFDAQLAEKFATIITLHRLAKYQQTDAAYQRVFQLLMHDAVLNFVQVIATRVVRGGI